MSDTQMDDELFEEITELCTDGDEHAEEGDYSEALTCYNEALDLIPEPKRNWEAATWVYTAIGDAHFMMDDYQGAVDNFHEAYNSPGGATNPFVLLMLGKTYFELGNTAQAKEYLLRAYMLEGMTIFEDEDPEYFAVIKDVV